MIRNVKTDVNKQHLQNDLYKIVKCSVKLLMLFNCDKCKCQHTLRERGYEI